jgi:hypothetical protein
MIISRIISDPGLSFVLKFKDFGTDLHDRHVDESITTL